MASFQSKVGWKSLRRGENKNFHFHFVPTRRIIENFKKIAKKLINCVMVSFQAKISRKRPRRRENKTYRSVPFLPDAKLKIPKK